MDPKHAYSNCSVMTDFKTKSHNNVSQALAKIGTSAGAQTFLEKRFNNVVGESRKKPDVEIHYTTNDRPEACDITISYNLAKSYANKSVDSVVQTKANQKHRKYTDAANDIGLDFTPLVITHMGYIEPQSVLLLRKIANHATLTKVYNTQLFSETEILGNYIDRILIALANGNGLIMRYATSMRNISENNGITSKNQHINANKRFI